MTFLYFFFYHEKSLPIANATSNCRKFSKCVTKAQLGHLRYGVSTLVLSLQLRRLCGRVYQCPDWAGVALKSTINWKRWSWSCLDESFVLQDSFATDEQNSLQYSPLIILVTGGSAIFTIDHGSGLKISMSQQIKVSQFQNSAGLWDDFFTKKTSTPEFLGVTKPLWTQWHGDDGTPDRIRVTFTIHKHHPNLGKHTT